jgi:hypothetical protein
VAAKAIFELLDLGGDLGVENEYESLLSSISSILLFFSDGVGVVFNSIINGVIGGLIGTDK